MFAPQSTTQSTTVYCQPPPPPRTQTTYRHVQSNALGVTQIIIGVLCIIFNAVAIPFGDSVGAVSHGFWNGILFIVTGSLGMGAAKSKSKCLIISFMVMCIISAVMTTSLLAVGIIGAAIASPGDDSCPQDYDYGYDCSSSHNYYYCSPTYRPPTRCHNNYRVVIAMEACMAILAFIEAIVAIWGSAICCQAVCCCSGVEVYPTVGVPQYIYPNQMMFVSTQQQQMQNGNYQPVQTFQAQYWNGQGGFTTTPIASYSNQYPPPQMASANQAMGPPAYNTTIDQHNTPTDSQAHVGPIQTHPAFGVSEKF